MAGFFSQPKGVNVSVNFTDDYHCFYDIFN